MSDPEEPKLPELRLNVSLPGFRPYRELGLGKLAQQLGIPDRQLTGHWCSRCDGIWFGYLLEVECPVCGNRSG